VEGNLKIGKNRAFLPVKLGGLGLFRIKSFLEAQATRWVAVLGAGIDTEWKRTLNEFAIADTYRFDFSRILELPPIMRNIIKAWQKFKVSYYKKDNNYLKASIFGEISFLASTRSKEYLSLHDLDKINSLEVRNSLLHLQVSKVLPTDQVITRPALEQELGGEVPVDVYEKIKKVGKTALKIYGSDAPTRGTCMSTFLASWKKGSKKFRRFLDGLDNEYVPHNIMKFAYNTETVIGLDCSVKLNSDWSKTFYSNEMRTFIFKLHNNTLTVNTILSHMVRGISRNCTFCESVRNPEPVDETVFHLFFDCPTVENLRIELFIWLTGTDRYNLNRHGFFCCGESEKKCELCKVINYCLKFFVWECKKRKTVPTFEDLKKFLIAELKTMSSVDKKFWTRAGTCTLIQQHLLRG
jgi:hypothetical protein